MYIYVYVSIYQYIFIALYLFLLYVNVYIFRIFYISTYICLAAIGWPRNGKCTYKVTFSAPPKGWLVENAFGIKSAFVQFVHEVLNKINKIKVIYTNI